MVRDFAPQRDPDFVAILLRVTDHLLERRRNVWPAAEFCVHDHVHRAGTAAQSLLIDIVERGLEALEIGGRVAEPAGPGTPVVGVVELWDHRDALAVRLRDIRYVVV